MNEFSPQLFNDIIGWQKTSFIDFPGTVSTVLFFSGCNLRCPYCHNADLVYKRYPQIDPHEINAHLLKRKGMIEGIVISGGEPTIHKNLRELILYLKDLGYKVKLDTNALLPDILSLVIHHIDYLAIDVKTSPNSYKDKLLATYDNCDERIGQSIKIADMSKVDFEVRITVAKTIVSLKDLDIIGKLIRHTRATVYLQKLNKYTKMLNDKFYEEPLSIEELKLYQKTLLQYVNSCIIRNELISNVRNKE